ncbi:MAG: lipoyl(octanoyl) transferase LipB [Acidobacteria bacterium]|nr:lipoyl(octanoyl) transferase LipB [Acidobacteriota bacterium]
MTAVECLAVWLGRVPFSEALDLQMRICELKKRGNAPDVLLLLEHPPTITLGRSALREHLLVDEAALMRRGIELHHIDRGGDITYHGPGQLVGYPLLLLENGERDVRGYMRSLEQSLIDLLGGYGVDAGREDGYTGVWTPGGKVAAMGVHISRWVTSHGFALNVNTDLSYYDLIVPCGIRGKSVTSMRALLCRPLEMEEVASRYLPVFGTVFHRSMTPVDRDFLENIIGRS